MCCESNDDLINNDNLRPSDEMEDELYLYSLKKMAQYTTEEVVISLTGLRTRKIFYYEAGELLRDNPNKKFALICFDIYRFMTVNDFCGREKGDDLIRFISECFKKYEDDDSIASHFRADSFVLLRCYREKEELVDIVKDIYDNVVAFPLSCNILPAFGICLADGIKAPSILCDYAKLALERVKGKVFNYYAFYEPSYRTRLLSEKRIENMMEEALENKEFKIYLQPKVRMSTGRIIGAEALVRWVKNDGEIIMPNDFIPVFEKDGFIIQLDTYVWREVFKMLRSWEDNGMKLVPISVNVSRLHKYNDEFVSTLCGLCEEYRIKPQYIRLELTESLFLEEPETMFENMKVLRSKGFLFSMDDYGSGYSSMNMLINQPVDEVKIDKVFLDDITSKKTKIILKYTIGMIKELDVNMIAEGVETQEQADYLCACGCDKAQGYFFHKPMPIEKFEALVHSDIQIK